MDAPRPAVTCASCERGWNSASMADGLRLLAGCPRCGGVLVFREDAPVLIAVPDVPTDLEPHLVLGLPRGH